MSPDSLLLRRTVVCASGLIYWGGVLVQGRRIRRRIGRSPNLRPKGAREKALWLGWFLVILIWVGQPWLVKSDAATAGLALVPGLLRPGSLVVGLVLLVLGYAGTLWAYAAMGDSWRIGIDPRQQVTLVTSGPFRWVRHPIYLLQIVMLAGAALLLPTALSLIALVLHYVCVRLKTGDEEKHLAGIFGPAYHDYLSSTGGLFPRFDRRTSGSKQVAQPGSEYPRKNLF